MLFKSCVCVRVFEEYSDWVCYDGEEFLLIFEGEVMFYSEFYELVYLVEGDSVYYDVNMGYMLVLVSEEDVLIFWVIVR